MSEPRRAEDERATTREELRMENQEIIDLNQELRREAPAITVEQADGYDHSLEPPLPEFPSRASPAVSTASGKRQLSHKIGKPKKFNGTETPTHPAFVRWHRQIREILIHNSDRYDTPIARQHLIYSCLGDAAQDYLEHFMSTVEGEATDAPQLLAELQRAYEDPHARANARVEYEALTGVGKPLQTFINEFRSLAAQAQVHEEYQLGDFRRKLPFALQRVVIARTFDSVHEFILTVQTIHQELDEIEALERARRPTQSTAAVATTRANTPLVFRNPAPRKARQPRFNEKARRRCFACMKYGHIATACPDKMESSV